MIWTGIYYTHFVSMNLENMSSLQKWPVLGAVSHNLIKVVLYGTGLENYFQTISLKPLVILTEEVSVQCMRCDGHRVIREKVTM